LLGESFLSCFTNAATTLIEFHVSDPPFVLEVSERPVASPLARLQAAQGGRVTNLRHETVTLNAFDRQLLPALDGTRDRAALASFVAELAASNEFTIREGGQPVQGPERIRQLAGTILDERLPQFARSALLVG
jgi:methyltransferase-like protein